MAARGLLQREGSEPKYRDPSRFQIHTTRFPERGRWGSLRPQEFKAREPASGRRGRTEAAPSPSPGPPLLVGLSAPGPLLTRPPMRQLEGGLASELNHQLPLLPRPAGRLQDPLPQGVPRHLQMGPRGRTVCSGRQARGRRGRRPSSLGPPAANLRQSSAPGPADTEGLCARHPASPASCFPRLHTVLASSWLPLSFLEARPRFAHLAGLLPAPRPQGERERPTQTQG